MAFRYTSKLQEKLLNPTTHQGQTLICSLYLFNNNVTAQAQNGKGTEAQSKKLYRETLPT